MRFYNIDQNSEKWDELRNGKFTASSFGDLFAKKDTATYQKAIIKVAYERITGDSEEFYSNKWMQRGHEREPLARAHYELVTFETLQNGGFYEYNSFIGASPDAKIKGVKGGCEFKCPSFQVYHEYIETGKLPKSYFWQVHGQMLCTGWDFIDYMPYSSPKLKLIITRIEKDMLIQEQLLEKLSEATKEVKAMMNRIKQK